MPWPTSASLPVQWMRANRSGEDRRIGDGLRGQTVCRGSIDVLVTGLESVLNGVFNSAGLGLPSTYIITHDGQIRPVLFCSMKRILYSPRPRVGISAPVLSLIVEEAGIFAMNLVTGGGQRGVLRGRKQRSEERKAQAIYGTTASTPRSSVRSA